MVGRKPSIRKHPANRMADLDSLSNTPVRKRRLTDASETSTKRRKGIIHHSSHATTPCICLSIGEGDTGQLGLGEDILERSKPSRIPLPTEGEGDANSNNTVQVQAGGMHSVCLTADGQVFTFGCNDEDGLGRSTTEEGSETLPGLVNFPEKLKIIQVSAGDSHTAAITTEGDTYVWGTFRDSNGVIGLTKAQEKSLVPKRILSDNAVIKVTSGSDHVALLTTDGELFSLGCAEQGQLGRVAERFAIRGGRKGLDLLLTPSVCRLKGRVRFDDVWAGSYVTFARCATTGGIYACGLNNYFQLGLKEMESRYMLSLVPSFDPSKGWSSFAFGQHHTIALDGKGCVHSLGRSEYGRLGLGGDCKETDKPTPIPGLMDKKVVFISCGSACSFSIDSEGVVYSWGMAGLSLGQSSEEDVETPGKMEGKILDNKVATMISGGGQHALLLVRESNNYSVAGS